MPRKGSIGKCTGRGRGRPSRNPRNLPKSGQSTRAGASATPSPAFQPQSQKPVDAVVARAPSLIPEVEDVGADGKTRRLGRRISDEQTGRAIQRRLGHLPESAWGPLRNKKGEGLRDIVRMGVREKKINNVRLSIFGVFGQVYEPACLMKNLF